MNHVFMPYDIGGEQMAVLPMVADVLAAYNQDVWVAAIRKDGISIEYADCTASIDAKNYVSGIIDALTFVKSRGA